jgi:aspartyl-tRNA(Asn)/glutamyl-tRNA(Gln) amidotransferase subunit A
VVAVLREAIARLGLEVTSVDLAAEVADAMEVHRCVQIPEGDASLTALGVDRSKLSAVVAERAASAAAITPQQRAWAADRRAEIAGEIAFALEKHEILLAPAAPVVAPLRAEEDVEVGAGRITIRQALLSCAVPFAQGPFPALSVPAGEVGGLPVGLQIIGPPGSDERLIALAARLA